MMLFWLWEGQPSKLFRPVLPRKRVFVLNLTHAAGLRTVFFRTKGNFQGPPAVASSSKPAHFKEPPKTQNLIIDNNLSALTPPRSAAIISVSVCSAELRLVLYV